MENRARHFKRRIRLDHANTKLQETDFRILFRSVDGDVRDAQFPSGLGTALASLLAQAHGKRCQISFGQQLLFKHEQIVIIFTQNGYVFSCLVITFFDMK